MSKPNIKEIDDVDDDLFISKRPQNYIFAEKKANDINERTSKMLLNSRTLVEESQMFGQSALEEISTQREALERVENDLDNINSMTRATQKHLNNMRSFFGGIKSLFSNAAPITPIAPITSNTSNTPSNPSTRGGGSGGGIPSLETPSASSSGQPPTLDKLQKPVDEFDANLSELGFGLGRLKEMAMKLGDEIGDQNEMLDRITEKSERAGDSIKHQSRQMQQLLKGDNKSKEH